MILFFYRADLCCMSAAGFGRNCKVSASAKPAEIPAALHMFKIDEWKAWTVWDARDRA
jgi:hypothetical protein